MLHYLCFHCRMLLHSLYILYNPHKSSFHRMKGSNVCNSQLHSRAWQSWWDLSHCQWRGEWCWKTPQVQWFWPDATDSADLSPYYHPFFLFCLKYVSQHNINNIYYLTSNLHWTNAHDIMIVNVSIYNGVNTTSINTDRTNWMLAWDVILDDGTSGWWVSGEGFLYNLATKFTSQRPKPKF